MGKIEKAFFFNNKKSKTYFVLLILLAAVVMASFLGEYITNNAKDIPQRNRNLEVIDNNKIAGNDFFIDEKGNLVSKTPGAVLLIQKDYERTLRIKPVYTDSTGIKVSVGDEELSNNFGISMQPKTYLYSYEINKKNAEIKIKVLEEGIKIKSIEIDNRYIFNVYKFIFFLFSGIIILIFSFMIKNKYYKAEVIFLIMSLMLTVLMSLSLPISTSNTWDEHIHYGRVAAESQLNKNSITKTDINFSNRSIVSSYDVEGRRYVSQMLDKGNTNERDIDSSKEYFIENVDSAGGIKTFYNTISGLPSALVIWLSSMFALPYTFMFILGRAINGMIYSFIIYFAIKKLKSGKVILGMIALIPTGIFQASTYNQDWWITSFMILGIAYLFSEIQQPDKLISLKEYIIIVGSVFLACGPKAIYFVMFLLVFLLKKEKFLEKKHFSLHLITLSCLLILTASSFLAPFILAGPGVGDVRGNMGGEAVVNATEQLRYIFSEPIEYTMVLLKHIGNYISPGSYGFLMTSFAFLGDISNKLAILIAAIAIAIFTDKNDYDIHTSNIRTRCFIFIAAFIIISLISTALYISFTPVESQVIHGVQERYLFPILFPVLLVLGSPKITNRIKPEWYVNIMLSVPVLLTLYGIGTLVIRLYY